MTWLLVIAAVECGATLFAVCLCRAAALADEVTLEYRCEALSATESDEKREPKENDL